MSKAIARAMSERTAVANRYLDLIQNEDAEGYPDARFFCLHIVFLHQKLVEIMNIVFYEDSKIKATLPNETNFDEYVLTPENDDLFTYFTRKEKKSRFVPYEKDGKKKFKREVYTKERVITVSSPEIKSALITLEHAFCYMFADPYMKDYIPASVHSYRRNHSYATCAKVHAGPYKKTLATYDISNYFHCITKKMVYTMTQTVLASLFCDANITKYKAGPISEIIEDIKMWLPALAASLCTVTAPDKSSSKPVLAMGLEPSGILANLALIDADRYFSSVFANKGILYSRYSDNLIISTAERFTDEVLAVIPTFIENSSFCGEEKPFRINKDKTQVKSRGKRQRILGVVVNEKPNIASDKVLWIRSMLYHLYNDCVAFRAACLDHSVSSEELINRYNELKKRHRKAQGYVSFMKAVNEQKHEKYNTWLYASSLVLREIKGVADALS